MNIQKMSNFIEYLKLNTNGFTHKEVEFTCSVHKTITKLANIDKSLLVVLALHRFAGCSYFEVSLPPIFKEKPSSHTLNIIQQAQAAFYMIDNFDLVAFKSPIMFSLDAKGLEYCLRETLGVRCYAFYNKTKLDMTMLPKAALKVNKI